MKIGKQTVKFDNVSIVGSYSAVGKKEGEGPLKDWFDSITEDAHFGEKSWEKAEMKMLLCAVNGAIDNSGIRMEDIEYFLGGDLLNQCISANFASRELGLPFLGLYGACSTMIESIILGSMILSGKFAKNLVCGACSHFCSAERQYRFPLAYGGQRPPTSQWTVTGAGGTVLSTVKNGINVTYGTTGRIIDAGISDLNNMGAAMAPAACHTITTFFEDTGFDPSSYDLVITGDLGHVGHDLLKELLSENGLKIPSLSDCGCLIFDKETQDTHSGGSGCGCCASTLNSYIIKNMKKGNIKKALIIATGALMSPTTAYQGETIPAIAHLIQLEGV